MVILLYCTKKIEIDKKPIIETLRKIKFDLHKRTGGLMTRSTVIGFKPRNAIRHNVCETAALATKNPVEHEFLLGLAVPLTKIYQEFLPQYLRIHQDVVKNQNILKEYLILDTPFTSGIINYQNSLAYHVDEGNIHNTLSCMLVFKNSITGGFLSLPQLNIGIELDDCSVLIFNGQKLLHGVTPITYVNERGYRYSIIFYSMEKMWECKKPHEELNHFRNKIESNR